MIKLVLVRHGQTAKNVEGKLHKSFDAEQLTEEGIKQINLTVQKLKEMEISAVYCSKEDRAKQSGQIIADFNNVPLKEIDNMHERNWGEFSGKPWAEIKEVLDEMTLEERYTYVPPQGESWKDFETRLIATIKHILSDHKDGNTVVVVSHGGSIRALMPYLLDVPREESFKYDPDNASLFIFEFDGRDFKNLVVNDTSHLLL